MRFSWSGRGSAVAIVFFSVRDYSACTVRNNRSSTGPACCAGKRAIRPVPEVSRNGTGFRPRPAQMAAARYV